MQGDIMLPRPKKPKAEPKPKQNTPAPPKPDFVIDETAPATTKERRVLVAPHKHFVRFWRWWLGLGRNQRFAFISALLLVFGAGSIGWFSFIQPNSEPQLTFIRHPKPKPKPPETVASPLT